MIASTYHKDFSMSKIDTLMKRITLFEKLSFDDRKGFLQALAQETPQSVSEGELESATSQLYGAIQNWVQNHAEKQADVPVAGLPPALRSPVQVVRAAATEKNFDVDSLSSLYQAARQLAAVANLVGMGDNAKQAWMQIVFPQASHLIDLAGKQMAYLKWWKENYTPAEEPEGSVSLPEVEIEGKIPPRKMPF
jgi:hypothetical protein